MFDAPTISMIDNRYKCLTNLSNNGSEDLCFDMIEDRAETTNLANEQRETDRTNARNPAPMAPLVRSQPQRWGLRRGI